jgi:uncharacterized repeat protein (TIGR01451 family)
MNKNMWHTLTVLTAIFAAISFYWPPVVYAATIDVTSCNVSDLITAINTANSNGESDTINLQAGCTYTLTAPYAADPDGYGPVGLPPITSPITLAGNGATITRSSGAFRLFYVSTSGNLTLENLTLSNGLAQGGSGGLGGGYNGGGGAAGLGGAIFNRGTLSVTGSTLTGNVAQAGNGGGNYGDGDSAGGGGGGLGGNGLSNAGNGGGVNGGSGSWTVGGPGGIGGGGGGGMDGGGAGGFGGGGGGAWSNGGAGGFGGGGGGSDDGGGAGGFGGGNGGDNGGGGGAGLGGAIFNHGGAVNIANSTFSGNTAQGGSGTNSGSGLGGGIFNYNGAVTVVNATFAANTVTGAGGGGIYNYQDTGAASLTLKNTILADTPAGGTDCQNNGGAVTAPIDNRNLIENNSGCGSPYSTSDPQLLSLADNGGDTPTHALLSDSPAIDAGTCTGAPGTDQRGVPRPRGATCDIGSYEAELDAALGKTVDDTTPLPGQRITYTLAVINETSFDYTNTVVSDTLSSHLTFAGPVTLEPFQPGATLADDAGDLPILGRNLTVAAGTSITLTFPVTVNYGTAIGTVINNTASFTSTQVTKPIAGSVAVMIPPADVRLTKTVAPALLVSGEPITYTLTFSNVNDLVATGVVITDMIPTGIINTHVISSGAAITQTSPNYAWQVQDLGLGRGGVITITGVVSSAPGIIVNTATITTTTINAVPANNSGAATATVISPPGTGPGGVGKVDSLSNLTLWLRAGQGAYTDAACTSGNEAAAGGAVQCWQDMSGYGHHAIQTTPDNRPIWQPNQVNGQAELQFDGISDFMNLPTPNTLGLLNSDYEMFLAFRSSNGDIQFLTGGGLTQFELHLNGGQGARFIPKDYSGEAWASDIGGNGAYTNGSPHLVAARVDPALTPAYAGVVRADGSESSDWTTSDARSADNTALLLGVRQGLGYYLNGNMAEVIIYNSVLNSAQRALVENYLSAKYNTPLTSGDKYEGDTSLNKDYDLDVAGIGQEANGDHPEAHSAGLVIRESGNTLDNGEYVLVGHKEGVNGIITDGAAGVTMRWQRVWYIDKTSANGVETQLSFDFGEGGISGLPDSNYALLYSATDPYSFSNTGLPATVSNNQVQFTVPDATLQDGYYTLGRVVADVTITKSAHPVAVVPGGTITYTLTFSNVGLDTATDVVIVDSVPVSVTNPTVIGNSGAIITQTSSAPNFAWNVQSLAPGQGGVITLTGVLSDPLAAGTFTNTATITLTTTDGNPDNNSSGIGALVIDNQPPTFSNPASALITPTQGITVTTARPLFDWTDATDNIGVVGYTLVMTTSGDSLSLQAVGSITVAQSNYTPANNLPNGVYTWTVSAYDAAGNVSNPVSPATFVLGANSSRRVYLPVVLKGK